MPTERELDHWLKKLELPAAPLVRRGLGTALDFFHRRMPLLKEVTTEGFLRGMDLHKEVRMELLQAGNQVAAFRREGENLFKLFYTKAGTSPYRLGIVPNGRRFQRFTLRRPVEVLATHAADYIYTSAEDTAKAQSNWELPGGGGGLQYIIPDAESCLETINQQAGRAGLRPR